MTKGSYCAFKRQAVLTRLAPPDKEVSLAWRWRCSKQTLARRPGWECLHVCVLADVVGSCVIFLRHNLLPAHVLSSCQLRSQKKICNGTQTKALLFLTHLLSGFVYCKCCPPFKSYVLAWWTNYKSWLKPVCPITQKAQNNLFMTHAVRL